MINRMIVYFILLVVWQPVLLSAKEKPRKMDLVICAIFQNEAPYLKEWIEYHHLVGVQRFYLFNHMSTDHYQEVLAPYIKKGLVKLIDWPHKIKPDGSNWPHIQCSAYRHGLDLVRKRAKWVAFLDTDEFLVPKETNNCIDFLAQYEDVAGLCVNWQLFGTSGVAQIPSDKLLVETLLYRAPLDYKDNKLVKSIVQPKYIDDILCPHYCLYKPGFFQVNPNREPFEQAIAPYVCVDKICINHYWTRDEKYLWEDKVPRHIKWGKNMEHFYQRLDNLNLEKDETILKFVPRLRKRMPMQ